MMYLRSKTSDSSHDQKPYVSTSCICEATECAGEKRRNQAALRGGWGDNRAAAGLQPDCVVFLGVRTVVCGSP